jgi:hypothetical protein
LAQIWRVAVAVFTIFGWSVFVSRADVTITAPTPAISADSALNGTVPGYTPIGDILIKEVSFVNDFKIGTGEIVLSAPSGWQFNPAAGVGSVSFTPGIDIITASIAVTASAVTITLNVGTENDRDTLTISGLQVQATDGADISSTGYITRISASPDPDALINGAGIGISFATLAQTAGAPKTMEFTQAPANVVVGSVVSPAVTVQFKDSFGHNSPSTKAVHLTLASGDTLGGHPDQFAVNGLATFSDLVVTNNGVDTLKAKATGVNDANVLFTAMVATITTMSSPPVTETYYGAPITFTAQVVGSPSDFGTPTGTVYFKEADGTVLTSQSVDGTGTATKTITTLVDRGSPYQPDAEYSGDTTFNMSVSGPTWILIHKGNTTLSVGSSASSVPTGSTVTLTATASVVAPAGGIPGGSVTFYDNGVNIGSGTLDSSGNASITSLPLGNGSHTISPSDKD